MQRACFLMHLKPERIDDYLRVHEEIWPEMLDALRDTGWTNFSLHLHKETGLVVGYVETPDYERATSEMAKKEVNSRWQTTMAEFFQAGRPDEGVDLLEEYFHLQ
ncbi:L-rhamnose mutarotase [Arthrobacter sedimenti]|uniref:L-rhamnose mutarotase n=1 Tax=Arthrobacter sedimenti TaxID=2694931 RepID=UPI000B34EA62|nr:L-rhamnose mutarotase [Arthrobacter sedimenti]OUM45573.1 L-rhamnose mutarotase [Arthrobacter agilis]